MESKMESRIKDLWELRAEGYSELINVELNNEFGDAWRKFLLSQAPEKDRLDVLDIGTGPGFFPIILGEAGHNVTGIDLTDNMLKYAKLNAESQNVKAEFIRMNCQFLKFDEDSFDLIVCRNLTWTLEQPEECYKEWRRVLRPGGVLLIFDANWNHYQFYEDARKRHEKCDQMMLEKFGHHIHDHSTMEESEAISVKLPMGRYQRPEWDLQILLKIGFKKVFTDIDLTDDLPVKSEDVIVNLDTPLFMVGAVK